MGEIKKDCKDYTGCEYKEISAGGERAAFFLDCYECFGWTPDERIGQTTGRLVLRRERRIMNKAELTRLQRHFEACMEEINGLERSKTTGATIAALSTGLVGTAFMAGSVFAVVHVPPLVILSVFLALPGFLGWVLPWFLYKKMVFCRSRLVAGLIEQKYDEIDEICRQGSQLLN